VHRRGNRKSIYRNFLRDRIPIRNPPLISPEEHYPTAASPTPTAFAAGIPAVKPLRPHLHYLGSPDEIESLLPLHLRPFSPQQGGGSSRSPYSWESCAIAISKASRDNTLRIEFVDPSGSGEYHITNDPCEKTFDALPGAEARFFRKSGPIHQACRSTNTMAKTTCPCYRWNYRKQGTIFDALEVTYFRVQRPPSPKSSRQLGQLPRVTTTFTWLYRKHRFSPRPHSTVLVPHHRSNPNRDLSLQSNQASLPPSLCIYGRSLRPLACRSRLSKNLISHDFRFALQSSLISLSGDQKSVPLRSDSNALESRRSRHPQAQSRRFSILPWRVPHFEAISATQSSLIPWPTRSTVPPSARPHGQFVLELLQVRPPPSGPGFLSTVKLHVSSALPLKLDEASHNTSVSVRLIESPRTSRNLGYGGNSRSSLSSGLRGSLRLIASSRFAALRSWALQASKSTRIALLTNDTVIQHSPYDSSAAHFTYKRCNLKPPTSTLRPPIRNRSR